MDFDSLRYWIGAANDLLSAEAKEAKAAHERAERDAERGRR
jgi:hypothetical protein